MRRHLVFLLISSFALSCTAGVRSDGTTGSPARVDPARRATSSTSRPEAELAELTTSPPRLLHPGEPRPAADPCPCSNPLCRTGCTPP
jgi:hypothetical protein